MTPTTTSSGIWVSLFVNILCSKVLKYLFAGISKETEDDFEEIVPSCGPLLVVEYIVHKMEILWSKSLHSVSVR